MTRLLNALRRRGPLGLAREAVARGAEALLRRKSLLFYQAPIDTVLQDSPGVAYAASFTFRLLTITEARAFRGAPADVLASLEPYVRAELPGQSLLLSFIDGEVAGWNMIFVGDATWPLTETATTLRLRQGDAIFFSAFTVPRFRGRHVNRALMLETSRIARDLGATTLWAWHEVGNEAPRRNMTKVGMTMVGMHERRWVLGIALPPRVEMRSHD